MKHATGAFDLAKNKVTDDFKAIVTDSEDLIKVAVNTTADGIVAMRADLADGIVSAKAQLVEASQPAIEKAKQANDYVHNNPWPVVGAAAAVGLIIGLLAAKR